MPTIVNPEWATDLAPDLEGAFGRAWRMHMAEDVPADEPRQRTTVDSWVLHVPASHPWWCWYYLMCVNLRPVEGLAPAHKQFAAAEYELLVLAQNPEKPAVHPHRLGADAPAYMTPVDQCHQFGALPGGDDQAREFIAMFAKAVVHGVLVPDQDHRERWRASVAKTYEHVTTGHPELN